VAVLQQEEVHGQRNAVGQYSSVAVCVWCQFAVERSVTMWCSAMYRVVMGFVCT
jgi:hypothetical protein